MMNGVARFTQWAVSVPWQSLYKRLSGSSQEPWDCIKPYHASVFDIIEAKIMDPLQYPAESAIAEMWDS